MSRYYKTICLFLAIIISCTSDDDNNITTTPNSTNETDKTTEEDGKVDTSKFIYKGPKKDKKKFTVFLCTANLFMHRGYPSGSKKDRNKLSDSFIRLLLSNTDPKKDDLIIFGFQELFDTDNYFHDQLKKKGAQLSKSIDSQGFSNTIAVFSNLKKASNLKSGKLRFDKYNSGRSAAYVDFPDLDLTISNTHLFGGRNDDKVWESYQNARKDILSAIIAKSNPTGKKPNIILGDFNCDTEISSKSESYWNNDIIPNCTKNKNLGYGDVKKFLTSAHDYLKSNGYTSLYDRSTLTTTTPFDTVSDWIYFTKGKLKNHKIVGRGVYKAMALGLSDHDFLWVRIEVEI